MAGLPVDHMTSSLVSPHRSQFGQPPTYAEHLLDRSTATDFASTNQQSPYRHVPWTNSDLYGGGGSTLTLTGRGGQQAGESLSDAVLDWSSVRHSLNSYLSASPFGRYGNQLLGGHASLSPHSAPAGTSGIAAVPDAYQLPPEVDKSRRAEPEVQATVTSCEQRRTMDWASAYGGSVEMKFSPGERVTQRRGGSGSEGSSRSGTRRARQSGLSMSSPGCSDHGEVTTADQQSPTTEGHVARYPCDQCDHVDTSPEGLTEHEACHYKFRCEKCGYLAQSEGRMKRHLQDSHAPADSRPETKRHTYTCRKCKERFTDQTEYYAHIRLHMRSNNILECKMCGFPTPYKHHLELHLRNHFGSKPFRCPKCDYSCAVRSMLTSHMKTHSRVKRYRCEVCRHATKFLNALKKHLREKNHAPGLILGADGSETGMIRHWPTSGTYKRGSRKRNSRKIDVADADETAIAMATTNDDSNQTPRKMSPEAAVAIGNGGGSSATQKLDTSSSSRSEVGSLGAGSPLSSMEQMHNRIGEMMMPGFPVAMPRDSPGNERRPQRCAVCGFQAGCELELVRHFASAHSSVFPVPYQAAVGSADSSPSKRHRMSDMAMTTQMRHSPAAAAAAAAAVAQAHYGEMQQFPIPQLTPTGINPFVPNPKYSPVSSPPARADTGAGVFPDIKNVQSSSPATHRRVGPGFPQNFADPISSLHYAAAAIEQQRTFSPHQLSQAALAMAMHYKTYMMSLAGRGVVSPSAVHASMMNQLQGAAGWMIAAAGHSSRSSSSTRTPPHFNGTGSPNMGYGGKKAPERAESTATADSNRYDGRTAQKLFSPKTTPKHEGGRPWLGGHKTRDRTDSGTCSATATASQHATGYGRPRLQTMSPSEYLQPSRSRPVDPGAAVRMGENPEPLDLSIKTADLAASIGRTEDEVDANPFGGFADRWRHGDGEVDAIKYSDVIAQDLSDISSAASPSTSSGEFPSAESGAKRSRRRKPDKARLKFIPNTPPPNGATDDDDTAGSVGTSAAVDRPGSSSHAEKEAAERSVKMASGSDTAAAVTVSPKRDDTMASGVGTSGFETDAPDEVGEKRDGGGVGRRFSCDHCGFLYADRTMYEFHMEFHNPQDPFTCNMCGTPTKDNLDFFQHIARVAHSQVLAAS